MIKSLICQNCNLEFKVKNYNYKQKYCSKKCANIVIANNSRYKQRIPNKYQIINNIAKVYFNKGGFFLIDIDNLEKIKKYTWHKSSNGYVQTKKSRELNQGKLILLHRYILSLQDNKNRKIIIDHIDGEKTNNLQSNLRVTTNNINQANAKLHKSNTTGFKGVSIKREKYRAYIKYNAKQIHLGVFKTKKEAAKAYNKKALELFGERIILNNV